MTTCCPDCSTPVPAKPGAREGRCINCRPSRQHSKPRSDTRSVLDRLAADPTWPTT